MQERPPSHGFISEFLKLNSYKNIPLLTRRAEIGFPKGTETERRSDSAAARAMPKSGRCSFGGVPEAELLVGL